VKKILYFMHVPWGWVKQRPHFLAEGLSRYFDVSVCCGKTYGQKKNLIAHPASARVEVKELFKLPLMDHPVCHKLNAIIVRAQLKRRVNDSNFVWLTHPDLFGDIGSMIPARAKVIYDCMDNVLEFPYLKDRPEWREETFRRERELVLRSDLIFASSDFLKRKLQQRYGVAKEVSVVNNALSLEETAANPQSVVDLPERVERLLKKERKTLSYIGTVGDWFDVQLLLESLDRFKALHYIFWGPCEIKLPKHERMAAAGPIGHRDIFHVMQRSDALIMPFKLDDLVLSIDPVKLYEYVYSCRPSIVVRYGETEKFGEFVYLYRNREQYLDLVQQFMEDRLRPKRSPKEHEEFARMNTWDRRIPCILERML
jgi:teichuronic acid biosynthesis glycosyltransferase TuaH